MQNFVLLRWVLYKGTAPEQKTKNAKTAAGITCGSCYWHVYASFIISQRICRRRSSYT